MNFALILTAKRENVDSVSDLARECVSLTLCTIYSLPCVILTNEGVTCGLDLACVALDLNLKKGLKCKF